MTDVVLTPVTQTVTIVETNQVVEISQPPIIQVLTVGTQGPEGIDGDDGLSAYQVALANGFVGTEAAWLASLMGEDGLSAYEVAVSNGFVGSQSAWLASLIGSNGLNAWTPVFAVATDGARRVLQVADWVGGSGTKPATGLYVAATGLDPDIADGVDIRGAAGAGGGSSNVNVPYAVALTTPGASAIVATAVRTFRSPEARTFVAVRLSASAAPTGADMIVDIKKNGTSIFLDAASRLKIVAGSKTSVGGTYTLAAGFTGFADDDEITIDVTQVGSTIAGAGVVLTFIWYKT